MENKEMKNLELNDDALDNISGGMNAEEDVAYRCEGCKINYMPYRYFANGGKCSQCGRTWLTKVYLTQSQSE